MSEKRIELTFDDAFSVIDEKIKSGGEVTFSPKGISMLPLIKPFCDSVTIKAPLSKLKKGDIVFFRRDDGKFVLHRIIKVTKTGYTICGDNQGFPEKNVKDRHIIGIVVGATSNKKEIDFNSPLYKLYVWHLVFRRFFIRRKSLVYEKAVLRRIKKLFKKK